MLDSLSRKKEKEIRPFTIKRNLLYQYVFFPLIFTIILIAPLGMYAFANIFISAYLRDNLLNTILLNSAATVAAFFSGLVLAKRVRMVSPENARYVRLATLILPAVNTIAVFIAYIAGGIFPAKIAAVIVNPLFFLDNLLFDFILENSLVLIMFLSSVVYTISFLVFSRKAFKAEGKKQAQIFMAITAAVTALALASCAFTVYPEMEYEILKKQYETLPFNEEVDYKFSQNLPFSINNKLVKMGEGLTLEFSDVNTTPRLDGATAFYPVYAAIAENCYSGLKAEMEKNDLRFMSDFWGDNIYLDIPEDKQNNSQLIRCAELIRCSQTTKAYNGLTDSKSDMVFAFEPSDAQIAYAAEKGVEFELTLIGYDAFCFFVNTQNPVNNLTLKNVQDIYSGKITNWKKVGGKNKRIFAFTRPKNSGSQTIMENTVMKDVVINTRFEAKEVATMGQIINVVDGYLNTPAAIGYTFMYYSSFMVKGESIKYLAVDGVAPTNAAVRSGAYIFSTPFYAVTAKGRETPQTLELLNWLQGAQGQSLIEKCGYVGL